MTFYPNNVLIYSQGALPSKFDSHSAFLSNLTPADSDWPRHDLWPIIALHFSQVFFLPNLVALGYSWAIRPLIDLSWPLHDLWTQHYTTLRPGVLPTKFGSHRAFLNNLIHDWPSWPLHDLWPKQCITLWSGVLPNKYGGLRTFLRQLNLWITFDLWWSRFENMLSKLDISKHDETHSRTSYTHPYLHPHQPTDLYIIVV